jgi:hypothetical protein
MYLAKANSLNITFMPMASDVYGSMSVTFLSVLSKAAEMISEIIGTLLPNTGSKDSHLPHTNPIVIHSPIKESSSTIYYIQLRQ